jgi:hypothetical protein
VKVFSRDCLLLGGCAGHLLVALVAEQE